MTGEWDAWAGARRAETVDVLRVEQRDADAGKLAGQARDAQAHARFPLALLGPKLPVEPEPCKPVWVRSAARSCVAEEPKLPV